MNIYILIGFSATPIKYSIYPQRSNMLGMELWNLHHGHGQDL